MIRKSSFFFGILVAEAVFVVLLFLHASAGREAAAPDLARRAAIVRDLGLTDLCLFTEARYTRHPSLADRHTPFQEGPFSLEHFPSGSLLSPPEHLRARP